MDDCQQLDLSFKMIQSLTGDSQKCCMDSSVMMAVNCEIGGCVEIIKQNKNFICSVWPSDPSFDKSRVKFEGTVWCKSNSDENNFKLKCVQSVKASSVSVDVIVNDYEKFCSWHSSEHILKNLKQKCVKCLRNFHVKENYSVNLESSRLAKLYGINLIVIRGVEGVNDCSVVSVHSKTKINIKSVMSTEKLNFLQKQKTIELGGVNHIYNELKELVSLPILQHADFKQLNLSSPRGILLRGPAGCGKSSIVKLLSSDCKTPLITINGPEVLGSRPGETEENVKVIFKKCKNVSQEGPCILFIDELDSLCPKRTTGTSNESRGTSAVISCLDEVEYMENIIIIGATNRPSAVDPSLRRPGRFEREILLSVPNKEERGKIIKVLIKKLPTSYIDIEYLASVTNGYVGADLKSLCNEAVFHAMNNNGEKKGREITMDDFKEGIKKVIPSLEKGVEGIVEYKPVLWSDIGGLPDIKQQIKQAVEWPMLHPEAFERFGLPVSKGVLLYGPPGCCKTTLVRAAATSTHTTFISLNSAQLFSPFVGQSERIVAETFQKARSLAPSIIFLDELDSIVGKRSESTRGVQERLLSTLLNEMDGIGVRLDDSVSSTGQSKELDGDSMRNQMNGKTKMKVDNSRVLVVAATNRPDLVDSALLRPGRLDRIIYVPPPDYQARLEILKINCSKIPVKGVDLSWLAEETEFYTGADLSSLCREAAMCSMFESIEATSVTEQHFITAKTLVKPSLTCSLIDKYKQLHFQT